MSNHVGVLLTIDIVTMSVVVLRIPRVPREGFYDFHDLGDEGEISNLSFYRPRATSES